MAVIYPWKQVRPFYQQEGYTNMIKKPLIQSHYQEGLNKSEIMSVVPHAVSKWGSYAPGVERLFMPFTFGAAPVWKLGIEDGYLNHTYEPFTILTYVVRSHYREMFDLVNGEVVENLNDYNELRDAFNATFMKCKHGSGSGMANQASVDEMIRMGSLFYILQQSCDNTGGLVVDEFGRFINPWNKRTTRIATSLKSLSQYAAALSGFAMSGLSFYEFCDRYVPITGRNDLWLFNIPHIGTEPSIYVDDNGLLIMSPVSEFNFLELHRLINVFKGLTERGAYGLALIPNDNGSSLKIISKTIGIFQRRQGLYKCKGMNLNVHSNGTLSLSNYDIYSQDFKQVIL